MNTNDKEESQKAVFSCAMCICVVKKHQKAKSTFSFSLSLPAQPAGATALETGLSKSGSLHSAHDTQGGVGMKSAPC